MIQYFCEDIVFPFREKRLTNRWLKPVAEIEGRKVGDLSLTF